MLKLGRSGFRFIETRPIDLESFIERSRMYPPELAETDLLSIWPIMDLISFSVLFSARVSADGLNPRITWESSGSDSILYVFVWVNSCFACKSASDIIAFLLFLGLSTSEFWLYWKVTGSFDSC